MLLAEMYDEYVKQIPKSYRFLDKNDAYRKAMIAKEISEALAILSK